MDPRPFAPASVRVTAFDGLSPQEIRAKLEAEVPLAKAVIRQSDFTSTLDLWDEAVDEMRATGTLDLADDVVVLLAALADPDAPMCITARSVAAGIPISSLAPYFCGDPSVTPDWGRAKAANAALDILACAAEGTPLAAGPLAVKAHLAWLAGAGRNCRRLEEMASDADPRESTVTFFSRQLNKAQGMSGWAREPRTAYPRH
ncbi:hypothetical protein SPF06_18515 [Sinomonas sp. JGH33]|uniref:Uncharacterized protein n=2 Tax=Sinomonas terricola TaxID=3110330 RepID=A0ABU5TAJ9_9MICC|nr:hypothetical protein [Sinomonas sp. JGH33]